MRKFIEELNRMGLVEKMVNSCIIASVFTKNNEVSIEAVTEMLESVFKDDKKLLDLFCESSYENAMTEIRDYIQCEVDRCTSDTDEDFVSVLDEIMGTLKTIKEAVTQNTDDLK